MKYTEITTENSKDEASSIGFMGRGFADLIEGLGAWRVWHLIGAGELRRRYARSRIGQFWMTLSTGISILIMAFVWSILFKASLAEMLPHMAISIILWQFIAGIMSDASSLFTANGHLMLNQRMECSIIVFAAVYRNILTLLHNLVIVPIIFVVFSVPVSLNIIYAVPALVLITVTSVWVSYLVGIVCARFRDFSNILNSFMQLAFYITPVIWKPGFIIENYQYLLKFNPFAYYLDIVRAPIIGDPIVAFNWGMAFIITFFGMLLASIFIGKYRKQLLFWI